jgi:[ribosomal protein S5]-alanine N-acetyltransferase
MESIEFPSLETERLLLRELNPWNYIRVMGSYNDEKLKKFFGYTSTEELDGEKTRYREGMTMAGKSFLYFHLIEKNTKTVMGWCGYHSWFTSHYRAEIGYVLHNDKFKAKGYMKEALEPVIRYGFENMELHRIEALVSPDNIPSLKLISHFGFSREGLLREHYMRNNILEDSLIFSLLNHEYFDRS